MHFPTVNESKFLVLYVCIGIASSIKNMCYRFGFNRTICDLNLIIL